VEKSVLPEMFRSTYSHITKGNEMWNHLASPKGSQYAWDPNSTYVHEPPFFKTMTKDPPGVPSVKDAYCLLNFGDSITTDHISPAGNINKDSPAAKYLIAHGVDRKDFNSYGSRRGNDEIMARGTFANIRIVNKFLKGEVGPRTIHIPSQEKMFIYDAAQVSDCFEQNLFLACQKSQEYWEFMEYLSFPESERYGLKHSCWIEDERIGNMDVSCEL